ncbi:hypothetical protein C0989_000724 [Termitomyces sp. Mn162]|nr:hypothetical protein C0989_000724 [Termitomyces sp. Mn162]
MVHHETKSDAMFEVLWKAGDKSWMSYDQVKDPNLLVPYLELLGLQTIEELKDKRIRQPPQDDPQVFLGQVLFQDFLGDKLGGNLLKPPPELDWPITHIQLSSLALITKPYQSLSMGHPNPYGNCRSPMDRLGHPKHHPFLIIDPITCMTLGTLKLHGVAKGEYVRPPLLLLVTLILDQLSPAPVRNYHHSAGAAVAAKGIVIRDSDPKGKGKARDEEEEMAV